MLGDMANVTQTLAAVEAGDPKAAAKLPPLFYDEFRKLAAARMAAERPGQMLTPTALVKLRYFAGLTLPEVAALLGVAQSTAEADWTFAKAWLKRALGGG
jgi:DNA-directed RNA polymerase specialized sigma24 family protein